MSEYNINHLRELEAESMYVIREVVAQFEKPTMLFSGGKDSIVMWHLARKSFWPAKIPFPLLHIDTGHNFQETLDYRDKLMKDSGTKLLVAYVQDSIDKGRVVEEKGVNASRNVLQTVTLLDALEEMKIDAAMGGGRRDEEKARAKERFFSHRDEFGQWDPSTGLTLSKATTLEEIIQEVATIRTTERGSRWDDKRSEAAMEDRKKEGYF